MRRSAAFTLLELLIVIAIIGILSAMLAGGVTVVRKGAKKTQARTEAKSIVIAMKKYRGDFFQWPGQTKSNSGNDKNETCSTDAQIAALLKPLTENAKSINYIEIPDVSYVNGTYVDPWGYPYVIGVDYSSDGKVAIAVGDFKTNVLDTVAVVSTGLDPEHPENGIFSWQ